MDILKSPEFQIIVQLLGPDYLWSASRNYGDGDVIKGAAKAYDETRKIIRKLVNQARERERKPGERLPRDLEFALLVKSLGWPLFSTVPELKEIKDEGWRSLAAAFWPNGTPIQGGAFVDVGNATYDDVYIATIRATSMMLKTYDYTNRAVLDNRVWQRGDPNVLVHFEVRNDLRSMILDGSQRNATWIRRKLGRGLRSAIKFSKSDMGKVSTKLMIEWARAGFIGSPAGAMISGCPGATYGWGALAPANGIPLVVCINKVLDGKCFLGVTPDHRAFDGKVASKLYDYLGPKVEELVND